MSIDREMDHKNGKRTHTKEYYAALEKKAVLQYVTTWMNLEDARLSGISLSQDKCCVIPLKRGI